MNLLLLSINPAAIPDFLDECLGSLDRRVRLGYLDDAAVGMPFAENERKGVGALGYELVPLRARDTEVNEFAAALDSIDAVYVCGGETFVLLEALRSNGTGELLADRVRDGLPYIGSSAGSVIAGPSITPVELMDDRSLAPASKVTTASPSSTT